MMVAILQQAPYTLPALLWLLIPGVISGVFLLVAFVAVHKRFLVAEFPGYVTEVKTQLTSVNKTLESIEADLRQMMIQMVENKGEIKNHDWRLRRLERERGPEDREGT